MVQKRILVSPLGLRIAQSSSFIDFRPKLSSICRLRALGEVLPKGLIGFRDAQGLRV